MNNQCPAQESLINVEYVEYGGFWSRFFAIIIDGLVLQISWFLFIFLLTSGAAIINYDVPIHRLPEIVGNIALVISWWLYFTIAESSVWQATVGKNAMGLVVTDEYGNRISFLQANVRYWSKILSSIFMIGFIMAAFTDKKQGLHDMIAGTLVVKVC